MTNTGERLLVTLWVGSLWCIGYIVAPTLFAFLDDRSLAGDIAGELFRIETWLSIGCYLLLIAIWFMAGRAGPGRMPPGRALVPTLMVVLLAVSEWVIGPMIATARAQQGADSSEFAWLHGIAATLYLAASALGVWLVVRRREV
jgi:hypothetical protein